jgi:rhomboid protease GluP
MHSLSNKLRIVYLPFISIAVGCLVGYSFLNWLLLIKLDLFTLNDEVVNLWLPIFLPWLPILIWLRPRLKALKEKKLGRSSLRQLFYFVSWLAVAIPTMIGQDYLATATGKLTHLAQIGQIDQVPKTKYYTVQDAFFDKADASVETASYYSGRYNENFNMAIYLTCPIDDYGDTRRGNVWLGTLYKSQISGNLSDDERESQFHDFFNSSLATYNNLDLRRFSYLERLGRSDDGREFEAAVKRNKLYQPGTPDIVLEAHAENFNDRNGNKLAWVFGSFGIGAIVCFLMLLAAPVDPKEMNRILSGKKPKDDAPSSARIFFLPNRVLFVTPLLIDVNIAIFVWMVLAGLGVVSFNPNDLLAWGGNFRPAVLNGEIWRLAASMFVHGGLMHLAGNLFMLFLVGTILEAILGHIRFLICYFICGIAGSIASVAWHPATVSIGASGAIMGGLGILIGVSFIQKEKNPNQKHSLIGIALFVAGYNLLMGFLMGGVDNAAHLGGLISGLFFGVLFGIFPGLLGHRQSHIAKRRSEDSHG